MNSVCEQALSSIRQGIPMLHNSLLRRSFWTVNTNHEKLATQVAAIPPKESWHVVVLTMCLYAMGLSRISKRLECDGRLLQHSLPAKAVTVRHSKNVSLSREFLQTDLNRYHRRLTNITLK
jgi:hypothetical protein